MPGVHIICIVDDDEAVREAIGSLPRSFGFHVEVFPSAEKFLDLHRLHDTACLILDVCIPRMDGLELRRQLVIADRRIPIIFITAHSQEQAWIRAWREDVVGFLCKPFSEHALPEAVRAALRLCRGEFA